MRFFIKKIQDYIWFFGSMERTITFRILYGLNYSWSNPVKMNSRIKCFKIWWNSWFQEKRKLVLQYHDEYHYLQHWRVDLYFVFKTFDFQDHVHSRWKHQKSSQPVFTEHIYIFLAIWFRLWLLRHRWFYLLTWDFVSCKRYNPFYHLKCCQKTRIYSTVLSVWLWIQDNTPFNFE
jgi:hypothetical protein